MTVKKFEDLDIWKISMSLTLKIYKHSNSNEFKKDFALKDQIRKAVVSINSNIVEGFERSNNREFKRFLSIAKGSLGEVSTQLYIAFNLKYIDELSFEDLNNEMYLLSNKIGSFIVYLKKEIEKESHT